MCYRKISLKNPVRDSHRTGFDKVYIQAPCNKCPSCRTVRSNDWLVRSYYEFVDTHNIAYFVTLDFDDQHLPKYKGIPCWDSEKIKGFLKRLRHYIGKFRYLYATDYGSFLRRPHYHMMLVPSDQTLSKDKLMSGVAASWPYGKHQDIELLESIDGNCLAAVEYVCGYVNKDIAFNPDDKTYHDMPLRYRPRVQASKGYGLRALEEGLITSDMLLRGDKVSLPVGRNGRIVTLPIPRYYEMKLAYDYSWHPEDHKAELTKNEFGVELAKNRYNANYVYLIDQFFASRHSDLSSFNTLDMPWFDVVLQCLDNLDDFREYVYYRPFINITDNLQFVKPGIYYDNLRKEEVYRPNWDFYSQAYSIFESFKSWLDECKCEREVYKLIENAKARCRKEIERYPQKRHYLKRVNYDFNKLTPIKFKSHVLSRIKAGTN